MSGLRFKPNLLLVTDFYKKPFTAPAASPRVVTEQAVDSPFDEAPAFGPLDFVMLANWTPHIDPPLDRGSTQVENTRSDAVVKERRICRGAFRGIKRL
jgi:hypothetical protein